MPQMKTLLQDQPVIAEGQERRQAEGLAVWLTWRDALNPSVPQTLQEYGGLCLAQDEQQSLWFFFQADGFLSLARLQLWAKLQAMPLSVAVMRGVLAFGENQARQLRLAPDLLAQSQEAPQAFNVWIHEAAAPMGQGLPGLVFESDGQPQGLAAATWHKLTADSRLPYQSSMGWYCVLKPLGNPLEKGFQLGWREFFNELEHILSRQKFKYTLHNNFLLFPLDNLRLLRAWATDFFNLINRLKESEEERGKYWPCVMVVVDKRGLNFNNELPDKIPLDWDQLMPDFPVMTMRNGYLMGSEFMVHEVRFAAGAGSMDDWCSVSTRLEDGESVGMVPVDIAVSLVSGKNVQCFYCGLRSHLPAQCPSRQLREWSPDSWKRLAEMDFATMNAGFREINERMAASGDEGLLALLQSGEGAPHDLARAVFEINSAVQHNSMRRVWLSSSKDPGVGYGTPNPPDDSPIWRVLDHLPTGELIPLEKEVLAIGQRSLRDYRVKTLNGFLALDRDDPLRAQALWKEAEPFCHTPMQIAHLHFLQARLTEISGKYENAGLMYLAILNLTPDWLEPMYRHMVCLVKMGFADQALPRLMALIDRDTNIFNRVLIDPEIERGRVQILAGLYGIWQEAKEQAANEVQNLGHLRMELTTWFSPEHEFAVKASQRVDNLMSLSGIANFVPYQRLIRSRIILEKKMQDEISLEARDLRTTFKSFAQRLNRVTEEAAWFPFPRLLVEFNRSHNRISHSLTWALGANLQVAENFNKAQKIAEQQSELLLKLENKIKFLKIIRDFTLFTFITGKAFLWMEVIALLFIFVGLPLFLYYGEKSNWPFVRQLMYQDKWEMQKALIIFTSFIALTIAAVRTAAVFEKRRDKLLQKGKEAAMKDFDAARKKLGKKSGAKPGQLSMTPDDEASAEGEEAAAAKGKDKKSRKKK